MTECVPFVRLDNVSVATVPLSGTELSGTPPSKNTTYPFAPAAVPVTVAVSVMKLLKVEGFADVDTFVVVGFRTDCVKVADVLGAYPVAPA